MISIQFNFQGFQLIFVRFWTMMNLLEMSFKLKFIGMFLKIEIVCRSLAVSFELNSGLETKQSKDYFLDR